MGCNENIVIVLIRAEIDNYSKLNRDLDFNFADPCYIFSQISELEFSKAKVGML